jgi:hypothetical protein
MCDDRRASGQQLPDRSEDTRPGSSFLRLPLPGIRPGWPIRKNTKRPETLIVKAPGWGTRASADGCHGASLGVRESGEAEGGEQGNCGAYLLMN